MPRRFELTDEQWSVIGPHLPAERGRPTRPSIDNRSMVNAMLWVLRTGAPWRDMPDYYPKWKSVYTRFSRWSARGLWTEVLRALTKHADTRGYHIDGTIVRAHQDAHGARREGQKARPPAIGTSRGGPSTKIHAVVDAKGRPVCMALTPGQSHEMKLAPYLLSRLRDAYVCGDRAYDAQHLRDQLRRQRCRVVIPSNPVRRRQFRYNKRLYRRRHRVENFFQRLKRYRRLATRYDKLAANYFAMICLACTLIWML